MTFITLYVRETEIRVFPFFKIFFVILKIAIIQKTASIRNTLRVNA